MANCPNCGSDHIQLRRDTDINWGRAIAGWAVGGVVVGAVSAVTGKDRNANACLDCGSVWKASDLHELLLKIKDLTGKDIDLSNSDDRLFVQNFLRDISPFLKKINSLKTKSEKELVKFQSKPDEYFSYGCVSAFMIAAFLLFMAHINAFIAILIWLIGIGIGYYFRMVSKPFFENSLDSFKEELDNEIKSAESDLNLKVQDLLGKS